MSHPLMVEAIETLFVPLLVYNNRDSDAQVLKQFNEPSWNNPVVRFLNSDGEDLIPRKDGVWTTTGIADRLIAALQKSKLRVPVWLEWMGHENGKGTETAEFAMHCYWEGEAKLGSIKGVMATRSGWRKNLEVVELKFDPEVVSYADLLKEAKKFECASKVFTHTESQTKVARKTVGDEVVPVSGLMRDAKKSDQKYYVRQTTAIHLPLTELQATKINSSIGSKVQWKHLLSPRQIQMLARIDRLTQKKKGALDGFSYPVDEDELPVYYKRLSDKLDAGPE